MSILIQGMKMPMNCDVCPFDNKLYCVAYAPSKDMIYDISDGRPDWCPLIELPPHGRLGDLDALFLAMFQCTDGSIIGDKDIDGWPHEARYADIKRFIRQAPTIIPADGGDAQ